MVLNYFFSWRSDSVVTSIWEGSWMTLWVLSIGTGVSNWLMNCYLLLYRSDSALSNILESLWDAITSRSYYLVLIIGSFLKFEDYVLISVAIGISRFLIGLSCATDVDGRLISGLSS